MNAEDRAPLTRWLDQPEVQRELLRRDPLVDGHEVEVRTASTWKPHTPHPAAWQIVKEYGGSTISRSDLAVHAGHALAEPGEENWVRAYMACQLWGVGRSGRVGWTRKTLADPSAPAAFAALAEAVQEGQPERAADGWAYGWNRSFTTKFAYAVAKALDQTSPTALVYDKRVCEQLDRLGWQYPKTRSGPVRHRRYAGYLDALHDEAARLGCQPDTIEWLLFYPPASA